MKGIIVFLLLFFITTISLTNPTFSFPYANITQTCKTTIYKDLCMSTFESSTVKDRLLTPKDLFDVSVEFAMVRAQSARSMAYDLTFPTLNSTTHPPSGAFDCLELLDDTLDHLVNVLDSNKGSTPEDIETWLSAALTNQATCSESLATRPSSHYEMIEAGAKSLTKFISNSLAIHKLTRDKIGRTGRNLSDGFPNWVSLGERKLLNASPEEIRPDAIVAVDGSGTHRTINEALAYVSLAKKGNNGGGGGGRSVIHVKVGTYHEYIRVPTKQRNVMLVGDGKGKSIIIGNRNNKDGWSTYQSATVAGMGSGFIVRDLTIINTAGPSKEQAVALRVGADKAIVHRCSIQGYQDTLYTHSNRQFYRDNDITGTVDFIFGNSAAVFQNCNISPRRPNRGQKNSITAQGRRDPNQNTGISIQGCRIYPTSDLAVVKKQVPTYLGRPWHKYSRVVVMESYIDDLVHPDGWETWSGTFALSTLYYGEYANIGPGASTSRRVRWAGVHSGLSSDEASKFTVENFISGDGWLAGTGVDYKLGL